MAPADADRTRTRLLDAAAQLFARHGFEGATIGAISRQAGTNPALISYHFDGKLGLYREVIERFAALAEETLMEPAGASARERLANWARSYFDFLQAYPEFAQILTREQMAGSPRMDHALTESLMRFFQRTRTLIKAGVAAGEFRPVDTHAAHLVLAGATVFFQLTRAARERYRDAALAPLELLSPDAFRDTLVNLFLDGIAPRGPSSISQGD